MMTTITILLKDYRGEMLHKESLSHIIIGVKTPFVLLRDYSHTWVQMIAKHHTSTMFSDSNEMKFVSPTPRISVSMVRKYIIQFQDACRQVLNYTPHLGFVDRVLYPKTIYFLFHVFVFLIVIVTRISITGYTLKGIASKDERL